MDVVRGLLAEGAEVVAYDPVAGDQAVDLLPEMKLAPEPLDAVEGAHALVVMTGWPELAELDPVVARERMAYPILVDARNALDAEAFGRAGSPGSAARSATFHPGLALSWAALPRSRRPMAAG
jgi:UDPglucose 6-dehydrogenase